MPSQIKSEPMTPIVSIPPFVAEERVYTFSSSPLNNNRLPVSYKSPSNMSTPVTIRRLPRIFYPHADQTQTVVVPRYSEKSPEYYPSTDSQHSSYISSDADSQNIDSVLEIHAPRSPSIASLNLHSLASPMSSNPSNHNSFNQSLSQLSFDLEKAKIIQMMNQQCEEMEDLLEKMRPSTKTTTDSSTQTESRRCSTRTTRPINRLEYRH